MMSVIHLAGGCFWGVEAYFRRIEGVVSAISGYANGHTAHPHYRQVCSGETGHAEAVRIDYDREKLPLEHLLAHYFRLIEPTSLNRQGNDIGSQYRTGLYYSDEADLPILQVALKRLQRHYPQPIRIECQALSVFYAAEAEHQNYLGHHPNGYCHIDLAMAAIPLTYAERHPEVLDDLDDTIFAITQQNATEKPFSHPYHRLPKQRGVYVDVVDGTPLFDAADQFDAGCGWPSFSRPLNRETLLYVQDNSHGMQRIEVRSRHAGSHLGHVFNDGPPEAGGLRYCINGAALRFVPESD